MGPGCRRPRASRSRSPEASRIAATEKAVERRSPSSAASAATVRPGVSATRPRSFATAATPPFHPPA